MESSAKVIASLTGPTAHALLEQASAATPHADWLEVRLDLLDDARRDLAPLRHLGMPLLLTLRSRSEGGRDESSAEDARRQLLRHAAPGDFLDWELKRGAPPAWPVAQLLISHHIQGTLTGEDLHDALPPLISRPAGFYKLIFAAERLEDCLKARDLLAHARRDAIPLICFAMGEAGVPSRLLAPAWGSAATFGNPPGAPVAAPGQLDVALMSGLYRIRTVSARTALLGVTGNPVLHSQSPQFHNPALAAAGRDALYLPLPARDFEDFLGFARGVSLDAASVTTPFKNPAYSHAPQATPAASAAQAANTLLFAEGRPVLADNTDGEGVWQLLSSWLHADEPRDILIAGTGPAARAAGAALRQHDLRVTFTGRHAPPPGVALPGEWRAPADAARGRYAALVNATPALAPHWEAPLDRLLPPPAPLLLEMDYRIALPADAYPPGLQVIDGLQLLRAQAEAQSRIFLNHIPVTANVR